MFFSPVVENIGHDGDEQTEQHDCSAGIHHWMQVVPGVRWEGQHSLQILQNETLERQEASHQPSNRDLGEKGY